MEHATPIMGWSSYHTFECEPDEKSLLEMAGALAETGLGALGYRYVNIDDGWMERERVNGHLVPRADAFPSGLNALTDRLHAMGFKAGIYLGCSLLTWNDRAGSWGHEEADAADIAAWGFDLLKYDSRVLPDREPAKGRLRDFRLDYLRMAAALKKTGRDIALCICEHGETQPWRWAPGIGRMWRTGMDIRDRFWDEPAACPGFNGAADANAPLAPYARPGAINDPDMLVVGMYGKSGFLGPGCTSAEYRAHFALWCLMAAPLIIGADVRTLDADTLAVLSHREMIAIDQDPLCIQARRVHHYAGMDVYVRPLCGLNWAAGLYNRTSVSQTMRLSWDDLELSANAPMAILDVWSGEALGTRTGGLTLAVSPHEMRVVRLTPDFSWGAGGRHEV